MSSIFLSDRTFFFFFWGAGDWTRALRLLGMYSTTELNPEPQVTEFLKPLYLGFAFKVDLYIQLWLFFFCYLLAWFFFFPLPMIFLWNSSNATLWRKLLPEFGYLTLVVSVSFFLVSNKTISIYLLYIVNWVLSHYYFIWYLLIISLGSSRKGYFCLI